MQRREDRVAVITGEAQQVQEVTGGGWNVEGPKECVLLLETGYALQKTNANKIQRF